MNTKTIKEVIKEKHVDFKHCIDKNTFKEIIESIVASTEDDPIDMLIDARDINEDRVILNSFIRAYYDDPNDFSQALAEAIEEYDFSNDVCKLSMQDIFFGWITDQNDSFRVGHDFGLKIEAILHANLFNECLQETNRIAEEHLIYLEHDAKNEQDL